MKYMKKSNTNATSPLTCVGQVLDVIGLDSSTKFEEKAQEYYQHIQDTITARIPTIEINNTSDLLAVFVWGAAVCTVLLIASSIDRLANTKCVSGLLKCIDKNDHKFLYESIKCIITCLQIFTRYIIVNQNGEIVDQSYMITDYCQRRLKNLNNNNTQFALNDTLSSVITNQPTGTSIEMRPFNSTQIVRSD